MENETQPVVDQSTVNSDPAQLSEERVQAQMVEQQEQLTEIHEDIGRVEEARGIEVAVDSASQVVEAAVDSGEGLAQPTAQVLEAAMEHFYTRLGVSHSRRLPALEAYEQDRLASSKETLEHLQSLQGRIQKNVSVAQEGIFARIGNAFSRMTTTENEMLRGIARLNAGDMRPPMSLGTPAWGRVFAISGKHQVDSGDVVKVMTSVAKDNAALSKLLNSTSHHLEQVASELSRKTFGSAEGAVEAIEKHGEEMMEEIRRAANHVTSELRREKDDIEVVSCDKAHFGQIVRLMNERESEREMDRAWTRFSEAFTELNVVNRLAGSGTVGATVALGMLASADRRAVQRILSRLREGVADEVQDLALKLMKFDMAAMHGTYKYLQASARR